MTPADPDRITDQDAGPASTAPEQDPHQPPAAQQGGPGWFSHVTSLLFIVFCVEIGLFLVVYPWSDWWADNYFARVFPTAVATPWQSLWSSPYFRGMLSGLGLVNLWIAISEVFRMFSGRDNAVH